MTSYAPGKLSPPKRAALRASGWMAVVGVLLAAAGAWAQAPAAQDDAKFRDDVRGLGAFPTRVVGSDGYYKAAEYIQQQVKAVQEQTNQRIRQLQAEIQANPADQARVDAALAAMAQLADIELQVHEFDVMVPRTSRADLTLADGTKEKVYPFWPASVRVCSTPEAGITGKLIYVKDATIEQLRPKELAGQIAVIEATARDSWPQAKDFGAQAIIVLGGDQANNQMLRSHEVITPVNIPRFYIPDGKLADDLRAGKHSAPATLFAQVSWERATAKNLYVLVRPALFGKLDRLPAGAQWAIGRTINLGPSKWPLSGNPGAIVLSAAYDASGLVPDLAAGAGQGVQPAALLAILRDLADPSQRVLVEPLGVAPTVPDALKTRLSFDASKAQLTLKGGISEAQRDELLKANENADVRRAVTSLQQRSVPLSRPMMLFFGGADSLNFQGTRQMLMALANPPIKWQTELDGELKTTLDQIGTDLARAQEVNGDPRKLDPKKDKVLIERIVKIIETDIAVAQDDLFRIRVKSESEKSPAEKAQQQKLQNWQENLSALQYEVERQPATLASKKFEHKSGETEGFVELPVPLPPGVTWDGTMLPGARAYLAKTIVRLKLLAGKRDKIEPHERAAFEAAANYSDYGQRERDLRRRVELYSWLAEGLRREITTDQKANNSRLIDTLIGVDLSDHGSRVGPMAWGYYQRTKNTAPVQEWSDWLTTRADQFRKGNIAGNEWLHAIRNVLDDEPFASSMDPQTWLCASMPIPSELCQTWGVPGFSMITLDDQRVLRDTPLDRLDKLDIDALLPQLQALRTYIGQACNDPKVKGQQETQWQDNEVECQVVSPAAGRPVPDLPREGFLATYFYATGGKSPAIQSQAYPYTMGIRRNEVTPCNAEGMYRFEGLSKLPNVKTDSVALEVFQLAKDGSVVACSDLGKQSGAIKLVIDTKQPQDLVRSLVFKCDEFTLVGLFDPRFMQELSDVTLLDQRRRADPQRFNYLLTRQMMAGFVEPEQRSLLIFRYGRVGNRLLLLNEELAVKLPNLPAGIEFPGELKRRVFLDDDKKTLGFRGVMSESQKQQLLSLSTDSSYRSAIETLFKRTPRDIEVITRGFTVPELNTLGPIARATAADFLNLNAERMNSYASAGVDNPFIDQLHAEAAEALQQAARAYEANDGETMVRQTTGAWALLARTYLGLQDLASDVIHAAIFLLLLCIPFSFCMERLLIGTPNIYKQIAWTGLIFAIMTAVLASFHPAFKISSSPLIIILAFAIIFMSIVVISVVYGKFDTELKKIRSGRGSAATTSFVRASVLMSAILLGIANMRKRKFRTALTSITIILITFAVLCFTSSSQSLDTTTLPTGLPRVYSGMQVRQRGFRPINPLTLQMLRAVLSKPAAAGATPTTSPVDLHRLLVERWWNIDAGSVNNQVNVTALGPDRNVNLTGADAVLRADRVAPQRAVLGLSPGEKGLSPIGEVIPNFDQLENGRQDIIYISKESAEKLKVRDGKEVRSLKEGDWVRMGGIDLQVAGLFPADEFYARVRTLSGESLAPINYTPDTKDGSGKATTDTGAEAMDLGAEESAAELGKPYEHLSATQFVIVPASVSRALPNASLRSVAFKLADQKEVEAVAKDLGKRFAVAMFAGYDDGVKMVAVSTGLPSVSGAGQVAIPLAIAGLIIFNTMMGSIAERRREIHVYTSLGLAPVHVGALFLAEAMTYGLIGTIFGYVAGQGAGALLLKLGWLGSVTLNYSGTSAMMTMGLILVIVLLSALVPARLASKIAAPSIERTWKVPMPTGDRITASLPFTINKTAADGVLAYLAEYFDAHQEGSIGKFSAGKIEFFIYEDSAGRSSRGVRTMIWLTPFDLGIRQRLSLMIHPGEYQDIYEVQLVLERMSGDNGSWYRLNRTFLTELRKQFLQWRSLSPQRMLDYVEESKRVMAEAPERIRAVEQTVATAGA